MIYFLSFIGGIISIVTIYKWLVPYKKIDWKTVEKDVMKLKEDLITKNYMPTLIVGVGRGGSIVGALLSGCLGHVPLLVIDRVYDWKNNIRRERLFEQINLSSNLDKILLVAGELHTGGTAKTYIEYFNKIGARQIKYLSFTKDHFPAFNPDFYYIETKNPDIRLPWMITNKYKRDSLSRC